MHENKKIDESFKLIKNRRRTEMIEIDVFGDLQSRGGVGRFSYNLQHSVCDCRSLLIDQEFS